MPDSDLRVEFQALCIQYLYALPEDEWDAILEALYDVAHFYDPQVPNPVSYKGECVHDWIDASNVSVSGGDYCRKCYVIRLH